MQDHAAVKCLKDIATPRFTSVLVSRFLISLQETERKLASSSRAVSFGEISFSPQTSRSTSGFIGSLGTPLIFLDDEGSDDGGHDGEDVS